MLTTIWSELRSRVAGVGGNAHEVQSSDLPAGGTLQMLFPSLPFQGLFLVQPLQPGCKLPLHQFSAPASGSRSPFSFISVPYWSPRPQVYLPSPPVFLAGLKQLPSPSALSPPQISPGTPAPLISRVSPALGSHARRTIHTFAPQPQLPGAGPYAGSKGGTSGGGRKPTASTHGLVSVVMASSCARRVLAACVRGVDGGSWELSGSGRRGALAASVPGY